MASAVIPFQSATTQASSTQAAIPIVNSYGQPIPRLWGQTRVRGFPIWSSLPVAASGGVSTSSTLSFALAFGYPAPDATNVTISRIWVAGALVYDITGKSNVQAVPGFTFTLYTGTETQGQDATIVAVEGADYTPAFRGLIYAVFKDFATQPYGGMLPEIDAEILQSENIVSPVLPFLTDNLTHSGYKFCFPDYVRNELVCIGDAGAPIDVFDIATGTAKVFGAAQSPIGPENNDVATPVWKNTKPYMYVSHDGLSNSTPLYLMNYETGRIVATYGVQGSGTSSGAGNITFQEAVAAGPGVDGNDDLVTACTIFNEIMLIDRAGDSLNFRAVFPSGASGLGNTFEVCAAEVKLDPPSATTTFNGVVYLGVSFSIPTPPPVDYSTFSIAYYAYQNKIARAVGTKGGASATALISPLAAKDPLGETVFYVNKFATGTLTQGVADMITLGTHEVAEFIFTGPKNKPWVSAIIRDTVSLVQYLRVYDTIFTTVQQSYSFNATLDTTTFTQRSSTVIPSMDTTNFARTAKHQFTMRPGNYVLGYASGSAGSTFTMLDVSNGTFSTFTVADTVFENKNNSSLIYTRNFDGPDIFDPLTQSVFYPKTGAGGGSPNALPIPGNIVLQKVDLGGTLNLGTYLKSLCVTAGYQSSDVAAFDLDDVAIQGSVVNLSVDLIALLTQVCAVFRVDIVESGGVIRFQRKPRNADLVIDAAFTLDDAASLSQAADSEFFDNTRDNTTALPAVLAISYLDGDNGNAIGTQTAKRTKAPAVTTASVASLAFSIPIIMSAAEALYWASFAIYDMWNGAKTTKFRVSQKWLAVECGDYISVDLPDGSLTYFKTSQVQLNADFSLQLSATAFAQFDAFRARAPKSITVPSITTPGVTTTGTLPQIPQSAATAATSIIPTSITTPSSTSPDFALIDNVMVDFADNALVQTLLSQLFATRATPFSVLIPYRWLSQNKSTLYNDGRQLGKNFGLLGSYTPITNTLTNFLGSATLLAAPADVFEYDVVNSVTVSFGAFIGNVTAAELDWLAGANQILIGDVGRWELVYFRDVVDNGDKTYTLSHLLRGMRGTDAHCGDHSASDKCVLVDTSGSAQAVLLPLLLATFGSPGAGDPVNLPVSMDFYVGPYTTAQDTSLHQDYADNGQKVSLDGGPIKPWSPVNVAGSYSGSDIVLTWNRRDRSGTGLHDGDGIVAQTDLPEAYQIDIWNGGTLKRTLTANSETVTYLAANQTTDGFSSPASLHVTVYQISGLVGRGWPRDVTIALG